MTRCKICDNICSKIFEAKILKRYPTLYYKCDNCDFVQTDEPFWLNEAYSSVITDQDIGLLARNVTLAPLVAKLISVFLNPTEKFLDFGGGYGVFVRLMRDKGYNFKRFDLYCENIFAKGFDSNEDDKFELLTAIEVFEHLVNPIQEIENMLRMSKNIFFTTELQPKNFKNENDWWYVMPETGQHISLYSLNTLNYIADKFNLNLYSDGFSFHLLTNKVINPFLFKMVVNRYSRIIINLIYRGRKSLLWSDYLKITKIKE